MIRARLLAFKAGDKSNSDEPLTLVKDFVKALIEARNKTAATPKTGGGAHSETK